MNKKLYAVIFLILLIIIGCGGKEEDSTPKELLVMTHDSFNIGKDLIAKFEQDNNVVVKFLKAGDSGAVLNQAILTKNNPMADVLFGVDNTFLSRALDAGIFEAYSSQQLKNIPDELKLDPQNRMLPVDFGDVCLNYDKKWFSENKIAPPNKLEDLIKPEYKGLTVVQNPSTSSPGLSFLLATVQRFGEDKFLGFWKKLKNNDVLVRSGWKESYWGDFTAASDGNRPIVVSYASSPPAEVFYSEAKITEAPTAVVIENGSSFRQIEFVGILKGSGNTKLAGKFIDFMLSREFQEDIPLQMFVFPSNRNAQLPEVFVKHSRIAEHTKGLSPETIAAKRDEWITLWNETVLK